MERKNEMNAKIGQFYNPIRILKVLVVTFGLVNKFLLLEKTSLVVVIKVLGTYKRHHTFCLHAVLKVCIHFSHSFLVTLTFTLF